MLPPPLSKKQLQRFAHIRDRFLKNTQLPEQDKWRSMSDDAIWLRIVGQVVVVGNAAPAEHLSKPKVREQLAYGTLTGARPRRRAAESIGCALAAIGTRYVSQERPTESRKVHALLRNLQFLADHKDGPTGFVACLGRMKNSRERIGYITENLSYIKAKGARDFLTTGLGMATDVIALDSRVMGIVRLVVPELPQTVNANNYDTIETYLITHVCEPLKMSAMEFDQLLFRNEVGIRRLLSDVSMVHDGPNATNSATSGKSRCGSGRPFPARGGARRQRLG